MQNSVMPSLSDASAKDENFSPVVVPFEPYNFVDELFLAATMLTDSVFEASYRLPDVTTARFAVNDDVNDHPQIHNRGMNFHDASLLC